MHKSMERYRDEKIPIDKFEFQNLRKPDDLFPLEKFEFHNFIKRDDLFPLIDKWLGIALHNGAKDLVYTDIIYSSYPFPIFKCLATKSLRELVLTGCDLMHLSLSASHVTNCDSLRKLSLSRVRLNENMLQTLLTSCPSIVNLIIDRCIELERFELRDLQKIRSLTIKIYRYQGVKIQALTLEHLSYSSCSLEELDIVECQNLKSLEISCVAISDGFLEHLISRPHFLESLLLDSLVSGSFNICRSPSLRLLKIENCEIIKAIDAPNLVYLEYKGRVIPRLKFAKELIQLKHSHIILDCWYNLDAVWFCRLRNFLSNSISWSQVSLNISKCNEISRKYLQLDHRVCTPQVDVLDVNIKSSGDFPTFVDALLWSCRPRRLNLSSTVKTITCFINRLMYLKSSSHSTSHGSKPRLSQLKKVKA